MYVFTEQWPDAPSRPKTSTSPRKRLRREGLQLRLQCRGI